jgi:hypothetical protein
MYRHESKETVIDIYKSVDWGDFVIVCLDMPNMTTEQMQKAQQIFDEVSQRTAKQYILLPSHIISDIEFYGVSLDKTN